MQSDVISIFIFQQQQRPDLSRLMQLQAAGAGLPASMGGLPPALAAAAGGRTAAWRGDAPASPARRGRNLQKEKKALETEIKSTVYLFSTVFRIQIRIQGSSRSGSGFGIRIPVRIQSLKNITT